MNNGNISVSYFKHNNFSSPNWFVHAGQEKEITPKEGWLHTTTTEMEDKSIKLNGKRMIEIYYSRVLEGDSIILGNIIHNYCL